MKHSVFAKIATLALTLVLVLSLAACGGSDDTSDDTADPAPTEDTTPDDTADTETPEDTGEKFNLMTDITRIDPPELEGTTWNFAGGYLDGEEMDDDDATQTLSLYGGTLQFVFGEDGAMQIVQGGGSLDGVYELLQDDDGSLCVGVTVDNDGQSIPYFCVFSDLGQTVMIALSDDSGLNGLYFVQE